MPTLPITLTAAGGAALVNIWLALRIGRLRHSEGVSLGDGGNPRLIARMRAHANFTEYAPLVVILIALVELTRGTSLWLWIVMALFLIGRVLHALGMDGMRLGRSIGTSVTLVVMLGLGVYALTLAWNRGPVLDASGKVTAASRG